MGALIYLSVYLAIIIFIFFVVKRIVSYISNPIHVRWELYPVAHEGKRASYGGSYLEDVEWWNKPREKSRIGELKVMIPEILFLKAVWEYNRSLWYVTFPFHFGLYLIVAFIGLLGIGAVAELAGTSIGSNGPIPSVIAALTNLLGPLGFILVITGSIGLIYKRITDPGLRNYATPEHFFNLGLFIVTMGCAALAWLFADPDFDMARTFFVNLISFNMEKIESPVFVVQVILAAFTVAYIPMTHMSHFFMKYFLYHDIRWGDEPNIGTPKTDEKISVVLNYPVSWSASHIAGHGKTTWAEVATFNPAAEPEEKSEKGKE
ncbi:MAG: nitrate reductase [Deltaproteobacteria bacterium]|nr:nitrate reductase [Deltaproteobacteria bacterium]